jgi:DNA-binding response OmpR family regulator
MDARKEVLVVDDDLDMAEAMLLVLDAAGYAARSAHNGKQALEEVAAQMPSLILLDMLMPVMNGWQFARELHARYGHAVPIVVVSAAEHVRARSEEIDADDVLSKPFDMNELLKIVQRYA